MVGSSKTISALVKGISRFDGTPTKFRNWKRSTRAVLRLISYVPTSSIFWMDRHVQKKCIRKGACTASNRNLQQRRKGNHHQLGEERTKKTRGQEKREQILHLVNVVFVYVYVFDNIGSPLK